MTRSEVRSPHRPPLRGAFVLQPLCKQFHFRYTNSNKRVPRGTSGTNKMEEQHARGEVLLLQKNTAFTPYGCQFE